MQPARHQRTAFIGLPAELQAFDDPPHTAVDHERHRENRHENPVHMRGLIAHCDNNRRKRRNDEHSVVIRIDSVAAFLVYESTFM
ncbi:hypothetical protein [Reyranella sp. CPCC 100927]|uniref:hypothetical protein n=1 Tax=Reyranella sp. CPCC 100927 TaxID=2599616 RepID=UPI0011B495B2|nr:hypothetical protein [Reyranella sp. CPCC 100927]TWT10053.1 hypothetical protein FQU96_18335 [Reyranella sp. CPCC 100927]